MVFSSPTNLTYETVRFRLPGYKLHPESPAVGCQMRRSMGLWDLWVQCPPLRDAIYSSRFQAKDEPLPTLP